MFTFEMDIEEERIVKTIIEHTSENLDINKDEVREFFTKITAADLMDFFEERGEWNRRSRKKTEASWNRWKQIVEEEIPWRVVVVDQIDSGLKEN